MFKVAFWRPLQVYQSVNGKLNYMRETIGKNGYIYSHVLINFISMH